MYELTLRTGTPVLRGEFTTTPGEVMGGQTDSSCPPLNASQGPWGLTWASTGGAWCLSLSLGGTAAIPLESGLAWQGWKEREGLR